MKIERVILREIQLPLVHFFETSFGRTTHRQMVLVEVVSEGVSGWGEVTCGEKPFYNEEWTASAWMTGSTAAFNRTRLISATSSPILFSGLRFSLQ